MRFSRTLVIYCARRHANVPRPLTASLSEFAAALAPLSVETVSSRIVAALLIPLLRPDDVGLSLTASSVSTLLGVVAYLSGRDSAA